MSAKPTTLDAIRMGREDADAITLAGEIADLRFVAGDNLSLRASKLFCLLIQEAGIAVVEPVQHAVPLAVLNETFHKSKAELLEAVVELHQTTVSVRVVSRQGRAYMKSGPILSDVEREDESLARAEVRFEFSPAMRRVIADSRHWAAISRRAVLAFESKYSLRLYLFLSLRAGLRKVSEIVPLADLRAVLGVADGALQRWQDVRRFALEPAVAELSHLAGFHVVFEPVKRGRRIEAVKLIWGVKGRADLIEAARELERPRVGRRARRDGTVEAIAAERLRLAEALASAPRVSRANTGQLGQSEPLPEPGSPEGEHHG